MVFVRNFRCYLTIANISASILIITISATGSLAVFYNSQKLLQITDYATLVFQSLCSVAWAWTLIRLYKEINYAEKLLPNKRIFFIHGTLLTILYLIVIAAFICAYFVSHTQNNNRYLILSGIYDILFATTVLVEMTTFFLVVRMMLPITK